MLGEAPVAGEGDELNVVGSKGFRAVAFGSRHDPMFTFCKCSIASSAEKTAVFPRLVGTVP